MAITYYYQSHSSKTHLQEKGFHTLSKNVLFPSRIDVRYKSNYINRMFCSPLESMWDISLTISTVFKLLDNHNWWNVIFYRTIRKIFTSSDSLRVINKFNDQNFFFEKKKIQIKSMKQKKSREWKRKNKKTKDYSTLKERNYEAS